MTNNPDMLTDRELEEVTAVFKSFETGLREATIHPKVIQSQRGPSWTCFQNITLMVPVSLVFNHHDKES